MSHRGHCQSEKEEKILRNPEGKMKYRQVTVTIGNHQVEDALTKLFNLGLWDVQIIDEELPGQMIREKNPKNWDQTQVVTPTPIKNTPPKIRLYFEETDTKWQELYDFFAKEDIESTIVDDEDWKYKYKEDCRVVDLTRDIRVIPSWEREKQAAGPRDIFLDPGMAFGTGHHETTVMCAKLMARKLKKGQRVLDIGTGSGILAILGQRLQAREVVAIDIDPDAVQVARDNVALNQAQDVVSVQEGDLTRGLEAYRGEISLVVANLVAELILELGEQVKPYLQAEGYFIVSGILREKEAMVIKGLEALGFSLEEVRRQGEWCAICSRYA